MKAESALFDLVHSLSQAEKRYFKVYSQRHKQSAKMVDLFDAIASMEMFSGETLNEKIEGRIERRSLPNLKANLFKVILRSLREYHGEGFAIQRVRNRIFEGEILYRKGLDAIAKEQLRLGFQEANDFGFHGEQLHMLHLFRKIIFQAKDRGLTKEIKENLEDSRVILGNHLLETRIETLHEDLFLSLRKELTVLERSSTVNVRQELEEIFTMIDEQEASFWSLVYLLSAKSKLAVIDGEYEQALVLQEDLMEICEQSPHQIQANSRRFGILLSNYLHVANLNGRYDLFQPILLKLSELDAENTIAKADQDINLQFYQLVLNVGEGEFTAASQMSSAIEELIDKYGFRISRSQLISIRMNLATAAFFESSYSAGLQQVNYIINDESSEQRSDLQRAAKLLSLIFHFELENYDLIDYISRSIARKAKKKDAVGQSEIAVVSFIKATVRTNEVVKERLAELLGTLIEFRNHSDQREPVLTPLLICWAESKLHGESMRDRYLADRG